MHLSYTPPKYTPSLPRLVVVLFSPHRACVSLTPSSSMEEDMTKAASSTPQNATRKVRSYHGEIVGENGSVLLRGRVALGDGARPSAMFICQKMLPYAMSLENASKVVGISTWSTALRLIVDMKPLSAKASLKVLNGGTDYDVITWADRSVDAWNHGTKFGVNAAMDVLRSPSDKSHWVMIKAHSSYTKGVLHLIFGAATHTSDTDFIIDVVDIFTDGGRRRRVTLSSDKYGVTWVAVPRMPQSADEARRPLEWPFMKSQNLPDAYSFLFANKKPLAKAPVERKRRNARAATPTPARRRQKQQEASILPFPSDSCARPPSGAHDDVADTAPEGVVMSTVTAAVTAHAPATATAPAPTTATTTVNIEDFISMRRRNVPVEHTDYLLNWLMYEFYVEKKDRDGRYVADDAIVQLVLSSAYELSQSNDDLSHVFVETFCMYLRYGCPVVTSGDDVSKICKDVYTKIRSVVV